MSDNAREALYAIQRAGHTYKIKGEDLYDRVREGDTFAVERNGIVYKYVYENSSGWVYYGEDQGIDKQSGWRACAAGNGIAVVVSDGYAGYVPGQMAAYSTSPDLDSWQMIGNDNGIPNNQWTDIAFADGKFIAVARGGQDIMTQAIVSTDGINWTGRGIFDGMDYQNYNYGVAYGDGTWLIVSTNRDEGFTSTDGGDTWTKVSIPCTSMRYVAFGNGRFVVVSNSQSQGARSTDASATSWETFNLPQNPSGSDLKWQDVAYGNGTWVAIVYGGNEGEGSAAAYSTDDAQTWNFTNDGIKANKYDKNYAWNRVTFGDGIFVAVSDNSNSSIMQSSDGITWIGNDLYETTHDKRNWSGIAYTGDKWFCVNYSSTNSSKGPVAVSTELATIDNIRDSDQLVCWYEDQNYKVSGDVFRSMIIAPPPPPLVWETVVVQKGKLLPDQDYFEGYTITGTTAEFERVSSEVTNFAIPDGFRYRWQTKSVWDNPDEKWTSTDWVTYDGLPVDVDFVLPTPCGRVRLQSQANFSSDETTQVQNFTTSRQVFEYTDWENMTAGTRVLLEGQTLPVKGGNDGKNYPTLYWDQEYTFTPVEWIPNPEGSTPPSDLVFQWRYEAQHTDFIFNDPWIGPWTNYDGSTNPITFTIPDTSVNIIVKCRMTHPTYQNQTNSSPLSLTAPYAGAVSYTVKEPIKVSDRDTSITETNGKYYAMAGVELRVVPAQFNMVPDLKAQNPGIPYKDKYFRRYYFVDSKGNEQDGWPDGGWKTYDGYNDKPNDLAFPTPPRNAEDTFPWEECRIECYATYDYGAGVDQVKVYANAFSIEKSLPPASGMPWYNHNGGIWHIKNLTANMNLNQADYGPFDAWNVDGTNQRRISKLTYGEEVVFVTPYDMGAYKLFSTDGAYKNWDFGGYTDTSRVNDFWRMFKGCRTFNGKLGGNWDTSNVTDMREVFYSCDEFNQDVSGWNTSKVTRMDMMFNGCKVFNQDVSGFDMSKVTQMPFMFAGCREFNQNISGWNVSSAYSYGMDNMFGSAVKFNQDLSGWCVSNIPTKPSSFDSNTPAWTLPKPVWGTCP